MAMQHVGHEIDLRQRLQHGAAEEGEALALVRAGTVDVIAAEILIVFHKIEGDAFVIQTADGYALPAPAEVYLKAKRLFGAIPKFRGDGFVIGENYANVRVQPFQFLGQRADHVGQSARLDKGNAFGCGEQYFHG